MSAISESKKDIAASLFSRPCTLEELIKRDFLEDESSFKITMLVKTMFQSGWLYQRGEIYHTYTSTVRKHLKEYELL